MALDYNYGKVKNWESVCFDERNRMNPRTQDLIWMTMIVGMGEISQKNHEEFFRRVQAVEKKNGASVGVITEHGLEPLPTTLEDVRAHIGLYTNASRKSGAAFYKEYPEAKE